MGELREQRKIPKIPTVYGRFVDVTPAGSEFVSAAVPDFTLDLAAIRKSFLALGGPRADGGAPR